MLRKDELRDLAQWGARRKLQAIERVVAKYFDEFPEIFASPTRPVLVKAEEREEAQEWAFPATNGNGNGNGHDTSGYRAAWTPARRAAQARRMKARARDGRSLRDIGKPGTTSGRAYQILATKGPMTVGAIHKLLKGVVPTTIDSAIRRGIKHGLVRRDPKGYAWTNKARLAAEEPTTKTTKPRRSSSRGKHGKRTVNVNGRDAIGSRQHPVGQGKWGRMLHEYLVEHGPSNLGSIAKLWKTPSSNLISSSYGLMRVGVIKKISPGVYAAGETPLPPLRH